jgi:phosphatidylinositol 4-kinase
LTDGYRWSFGGNRLQIKAEAHLLADVDAALVKVAHIGSRPNGSLKSLRAKQDLLHLLLDNEQNRLIVWLFPLQPAPTHLLSSRSAGKTPPDVCVRSSILARNQANCTRISCLHF